MAPESQWLVEPRASLSRLKTEKTINECRLKHRYHKTSFRRFIGNAQKWRSRYLSEWFSVRSRNLPGVNNCGKIITKVPSFRQLDLSTYLLLLTFYVKYFQHYSASKYKLSATFFFSVISIFFDAQYCLSKHAQKEFWGTCAQSISFCYR